MYNEAVQRGHFMWNKDTIHAAVEAQRSFFNEGKTLDVSWRIEQLRRLKIAVQTNEKKLTKALYDDLGRSETEAYLTDVGVVIAEINETVKGLKKWAKPETHFSGAACFPSLITKVYKMPYGVSLIISPFNFPILLTLGVLIASIAGGNTALIKTSSKSIHCTQALKDLIASAFPAEYITVIDGGHEIADLCLEERFDKIFYTGSPKVGVHVMEKAAKHLDTATILTSKSPTNSMRLKIMQGGTI